MAKRGISWVLFICIWAVPIGAQVPTIGKPETLEVANWNIEWLGKGGNYGPSNDALQQENVERAMKALDFDIWGVGEISSKVAWDSLLSHLSDYSGVLATYSQEQKTGLIFRKSEFRLLYSKHILALYEREFAGGRLPLEVALEYQPFTGSKDTLYLFVIHLKANTGTNSEKADAYDLRKRSSEALKNYLDISYKNKKCMVIGDWNDDVDVSIYNSWTSPFSALLADTMQYFFPSKALSLTGQRTTTGYNSVIDHQMMNKHMRTAYIPGSCSVVYLQNYIGNYANTTSDHYPVYSTYQPLVWQSLATRPLNKDEDIYFVFDPNSHQIFGKGAQVTVINIYDAMGRALPWNSAGENRYQIEGSWPLCIEISYNGEVKFVRPSIRY